MSNTPMRWACAIDGKYERISATRNNANAFLGNLLDQIASVAKMTILNVAVSCIKEDLSKLDKDAFDDEGGYSALALISTSHIALHLWPERGLFMLDLVSCRPFLPSDVFDVISSALVVSEVHHHSVHVPQPNAQVFYYTPAEMVSAEDCHGRP